MQVTGVGRLAYLRAGFGIGDGAPQPPPAFLPTFLPRGAAADFEDLRRVERGLDAQALAVLVVSFDAVLADEMFEAHPLPSHLITGDGFGTTWPRSRMMSALPKRVSP